MKAAWPLIATLVALSPQAVSAASASTNEVEVKVTRVHLPDSMPGSCRVEGTIERVRRGDGSLAGHKLSLSVPCSSGQAIALSDLGPRLDAVALSRSRRGLAHLDRQNNLVPFNRLGEASVGYELLDAVGVTPGI
jgi:hypothetical protein